jgi:hypothetical protein
MYEFSAYFLPNLFQMVNATATTLTVNLSENISSRKKIYAKYKYAPQ